MDVNRRRLLGASLVGMTVLAGCNGASGGDGTPTEEPVTETEGGTDRPGDGTGTEQSGDGSGDDETSTKSMDADPEDTELVVTVCADEERNLEPGQVDGVDTDNDGDIDVVRVVVECPNGEPVQPQNRDLDGDGQLEVLVPTCRLDPGVIRNEHRGDVLVVYYGVACKEGEPVDETRFEDVDGDGIRELVVSTCDLPPGEVKRKKVAGTDNDVAILWVGVECENGEPIAPVDP